MTRKNIIIEGKTFPDENKEVTDAACYINDIFRIYSMIYFNHVVDGVEYYCFEILFDNKVEWANSIEKNSFCGGRQLERMINYWLKCFRK